MGAWILNGCSIFAHSASQQIQWPFEFWSHPGFKKWGFKQATNVVFYFYHETACCTMGCPGIFVQISNGKFNSILRQPAAIGKENLVTWHVKCSIKHHLLVKFIWLYLKIGSLCSNKCHLMPHCTCHVTNFASPFKGFRYLFTHYLHVYLSYEHWEMIGLQSSCHRCSCT